jgi:hypothetical protein
VPGKADSYYDFYYMFSGIVQHELYHAGQIVMLKKAAAGTSLSGVLEQAGQFVKVL